MANQWKLGGSKCLSSQRIVSKGFGSFPLKASSIQILLLYAKELYKERGQTECERGYTKIQLLSSNLIHNGIINQYNSGEYSHFKQLQIVTLLLSSQ